MYRIISVILSLFVFGIPTAAFSTGANCGPGSRVELDLDPKLLEKIGFKPSGEVFKYIQFEKLRYSIGPSEPFKLPVSGGGEQEFNLHPVEVEFSAAFLSPRRLFLSEVRKNLPKPGRNDSTGVEGGFMRFHNKSKVRLSANVWYVDNSSKIKQWRQGKSNTPVWLDIRVALTSDRRDLAIKPNIETGPSRVSGPLTKLLDVIFLPISIPLKVIGEPTIGEAIDKDIARKVDTSIDGRLAGKKDEITHLFSVHSFNNLFSGKTAAFLAFSKKELFHSEATGFRGVNPAPIDLGIAVIPAPIDAKIQFISERVSERNFPTSYRTLKAACQFLADINLLASLQREDPTEPKIVSVKPGQNLDMISSEVFGSTEYAMTIAQENGRNRYFGLEAGSQLNVPLVSKMIDGRYHFTEEGDNLWSILEAHDVPANRISEIAKKNKLRANGDLIYPGMLIDLR